MFGPACPAVWRCAYDRALVSRPVALCYVCRVEAPAVSRRFLTSEWIMSCAACVGARGPHGRGRRQGNCPGAGGPLLWRIKQSTGNVLPRPRCHQARPEYLPPNPHNAPQLGPSNYFHSSVLFYTFDISL